MKAISARRVRIALLLFSLCGPVHGLAQTTRHYYIAAEDVAWDFAPSGVDLVHGGPIQVPWNRNTIWPKTRYIEYTDASFGNKKPQPQWLGILGPIIRGEVGDTIQVHFLNRAKGSYGIHPHGLRYDKDSEGARYASSGAGAEIPEGGSFTYTWFVEADSGPGLNDPSSVVWWYHSDVDEPLDTNRGLLGPIIITTKGMANPDATPKNVDLEFILAFFVFDENNGDERGLMHAINGYIFGNLQGLVMPNGSKVRWYLLGMGNESDMHSAHWHGKTVAYQNRRTDVIELLPGSMAVADMNADNPGTWMIHCHVADHIESGMITTYTIQP